MADGFLYADTDRHDCLVLFENPASTLIPAAPTFTRRYPIGRYVPIC